MTCFEPFERVHNKKGVMVMAVAKKTTVKKPRAKKAVKQTFIAIVIDRSSSMSSIQAAAVSAVNEQIETIKANAKLTGKTYLSLVQFNQEVETLFDKKAIKDVKALVASDYQPFGSTAMLDAVDIAIKGLQEDVEETDDTGYLVVVISDGYENASKTHPSTLAAKISALQATGKWTFTYMLSNVDLATVTAGLHIPMGNVSSFVSNTVGMAGASFAMSGSYTAYSSMRSAGVKSTANFYNQNNPSSPTIDVNALDLNKTK